MRIGVDARLLSAPLTGIGRYTHEMVNALIRAGADLTLYMPAPLAHPLETGPGRYTVIASRMKGRVGRFLWGQFILSFVVRRDRPDIFWGPTHRLPNFLPRKIIGCLTIHDLVWKFSPETMRRSSRMMERMLMPIAVRRADQIVAVSNHTRGDILRVFPGLRASITTIYPGVSARPAGYGSDYLEKWQIDRPYVLFVGTLEPRKNLQRLLEAYISLAADIRKKACLVIAGGTGWGNFRIGDVITGDARYDQVRLTGYVTERQLTTLYENALCLAMPSLYEGFGLPIVEAMAYALPILTSDVASMPEVAADAARLVDPYDVNAIAVELETLIRSTEVVEHLREASHRNAQRFDWDKAAAAILKLWSLTERRSA